MATEEQKETLQKEVTAEEILQEDTTDSEEVVEKSAEELLQEQIEKLQEEVKASEDKYLRLYAEFENFKRRKNQEIDTINAYKSQKVITEILPSLDNYFFF